MPINSFLDHFCCNTRHTRKGQSLIEVLIAVTIGALMIGAVATLIVTVLRIGSQAQKSQAGAALGKELLENVRVWTERSWYNVASLSTSSANHYYLSASSSPFSVLSGDETAIVASTTYTRYFYVENVGRDAAGKILASGGVDDPSTRKITVVYSWPQSAANTLIAYLTRSANNIFFQTNWSGGPGQNGPATTTNSKFSTSTEVDYSSSTGSIILILP